MLLSMFCVLSVDVVMWKIRKEHPLIINENHTTRLNEPITLIDMKWMVLIGWAAYMLFDLSFDRILGIYIYKNLYAADLYKKSFNLLVM